MRSSHNKLLEIKELYIMNLFKAIRIGVAILDWYEEASEDDQITGKEIGELLAKITTSELAQHINIEL